MNINELREQWHRDAEQAHDWHEAAWELMHELDDARGELAASQRERDVFLEDARRAYAERDEARAETREVRKSWQKDYNIADERATKAEAERDEARSQFLQATQSGKWAYAVELEEKIERMYKDATAVMDIAGRSGSRVIDLEARLEALQGELEIAMGTGDWVHVNQALKIVKGKL